ncbi:MAG: vWA domain-containing protein [Streptosporangiaceae bacterium]
MGAARPAPDPAAGDLAEVSARFGAALRAAGLPVGPGRAERFAVAVTVARPATLDTLYQCALATLTSSRDQAEVLRAVFEQVFGTLTDPAGRNDRTRQGAEPPAPGDLLARAAREARARTLEVETIAGADPAAAEAGQGHAQDAGSEVEHRLLGADLERLASKDFAELTDDELADVAALMRRITLAVPERASRRQRRRPGGTRTDLRATLRQARRTGGHAFALIGRTPARRPRRLIMLCDISGSMEPYARAMIQLLYCAAGGAGAEVFTFATRLTRLTPVLARSGPDLALRRAGQAASDWLGGTRIGAALKEFNDGYGRRGMARGAVMVIISDGWETGDPEQVRREMERLSLVAFRIVWVNPRTKSTAYQPLAGGMAAAWPHCDAVVSGHTVRALDTLAAVLADPVRRRAEIRPGAA